MHSKVKKHFRKADPRLFKILQKIGALEEISSIHPREYFFRLCRNIVAQQLSGRVADTFMERFIALFPKQKNTPQITPKLLLTFSDQKLRNIGISWAKVKYLKDLAQKIEKKEIVLGSLHQLSNEEVAAELMKVKGIGNWTAEMFLMFSLGRQDVFSYGDLGLKKAIEKIYRMKKLTKSRVEKLAKRWAPYRTWACRILWSSHDNTEQK